TTHFYYAGWKLCDEYDVQWTLGGDVENAKYQYVWGPRHDDELVCRDDRHDTLVAELNDGIAGGGSGSSGGRQYQHHNRGWNIRAVTDEAGTVLERYLYDPHGKPTVLNAAGTTVLASSQLPGGEQDYGFTNQRYDRETGLWYFKHRYLDDGLGRFISRDPAGYVDGMNLYTAYFVLTGTDPLGLYRTEEEEDKAPFYLKSGPQSCMDCHGGRDSSPGVTRLLENVGSGVQQTAETGQALVEFLAPNPVESVKASRAGADTMLDPSAPLLDRFGGAASWVGNGMGAVLDLIIPGKSGAQRAVMNKADDLAESAATRSARSPSAGSPDIPNSQGASDPNVLSGHGAWTPGDGDTIVPEGTAVTILAGPGRETFDDIANKVELGEMPSADMLDRMTGARTYLPGAEMPNLTLYAPDSRMVIKGNPTTVAEPTLLSQLLQPGLGNVNWAACLTGAVDKAN
ncbi:MAG: RHS repeat-associated core domain-containing protein, partial [Planctomycetota bacterium]